MSRRPHIIWCRTQTVLCLSYSCFDWGIWKLLSVLTFFWLCKTLSVNYFNLSGGLRCFRSSSYSVYSCVHNARNSVALSLSVQSVDRQAGCLASKLWLSCLLKARIDFAFWYRCESIGAIVARTSLDTFGSVLKRS